MTQFIRLSRPEILHALTEAAYRKAGFRQGTGVKGVISSFSMGGEGRPSQATIKLDVTAATLPEQAAEQHMEAASADLAVEVGDADLYLDPDTSTIETVAHAAWDLLKTIPFEFLPVDCREAMGWGAPPIDLAGWISKLMVMVAEAKVDRLALSGVDSKDGWPVPLVALAKRIGHLVGDYEDVVIDLERKTHPLAATLPADFYDRVDAAFERMKPPREPEPEQHVATGGRSILFLGAEVPPEPPVPKIKPQTFLPPRRASYTSSSLKASSVLVHQVLADGRAFIEYDDGARGSVKVECLIPHDGQSW